MSDDNLLPPQRPSVQLLDELESIKGALTSAPETASETPADIPLLDDMVIGNLNANAKLLNIGEIFEEETSPRAEPAAEMPMQFPRFTLNVDVSDDPQPADVKPAAASAAPIKQRVRPDYSRDVLIQEIVDEFIPHIEAALQKRLRALDDDALQNLFDEK